MTVPRPLGQFALQAAAAFVTFGGVRLFVAVVLLGLTAPPLRAQGQERKLVDRLLRPNLSLQNPAQGKTFESRSQATKQAPVRAFYVQKPSRTKTFSSAAAVPTKDFTTRDFHPGPTQVTPSAFAWASNARASYRTGPAWALGAAPESGKSISASEFRTRAFTGRGKSQKSLRQQDTPLTVEQVRELLNKNK